MHNIRLLELDHNSCSSYFLAVSDALFSNWPEACINDDKCESQIEVEVKLRAEHNSKRRVEIIGHSLHTSYLPITILAVEFEDEEDYDGLVAGSVSICECDMFLSTLTPWISSLWVLESHKGKGVSTLLMKEVLELVKRLGFNEIFLYSKVSLPYLQTMYKKYGFIEFERVFHLGQEVSVMRKVEWDDE